MPSVYDAGKTAGAAPPPPGTMPGAFYPPASPPNQYPTSESQFELTQPYLAGQDPYGLPPDWDYKTSLVGPDGEPLPTGAVGWLPDGRPFYGSGITGWLNEARYKLTAPKELPKQAVTDAAADAVNMLLEG